MVFECVFPDTTKGNGLAQYVESLTSEGGLQLLEQFQSAAVIEGEWDAAMGFLRQCREYVLQHDAGGPAVTTVHIHNL